ncbi:DNA polymerase III subunit alpha [Chitinophaga sp. MM2321]|uniref:DNA polymerase III subunit alpha n=1 Tax=Chitinophaga sp. MM2321 TaxID=3137178 RepID=UPI0032D58854
MYLNCKTYYSLRYGTYSTQQLVDAAVECGVKTLALTNINSTFDAWDFVDFCQQAGIKPILGTEIRNDNKLCYVLLAKNNKGFLNINRFLSDHLISRTDFPERAPDFDHVIVIYPLGSVDPPLLKANEYIGVQVTEVTRLYGINWKDCSGKFVIRHPVTFQDKIHYNIHRLLRAVDRNIILSKQDPGDCAAAHETFLHLADLLISFQQYPQLLSNTFLLLEECSIEIDFKADKNKKYYSASKQDDLNLLRMLAVEGLEYRYGKQNKQATERVEKELKIIDELNFSAYFLITWDFIRYAQQRGFYYVGRGSGANSIVAYCLKITDVDPIQLDLYFERFLNPGRTSPPDFDIDFSWTDRDLVMDYVFKRYGKEHVALLGMISTFQSRAAIREFGKVYALPATEIDALMDGNYSPTDKHHRQILRYSNLVQDWPNQISIHPCGMLISEEPLHQYTACTMLQKQMPVAMLDMFSAEKVGLFKFDVLSQRGLGHIRDTINLVKESKGIAIDIHKVSEFKNDPLINQRLATGETIGCFYIESPSMRVVLRKLSCDNYISLVAASSIIRPGVGSSGMMDQYIKRSHHPDEFQYLHPIMKDLLEETFGVMVYQEDVIKVGHYFGGLSLEDADILRRAMSGKYRGNQEMQRLENTFITNCEQKGYAPQVYLEVWRQMASFAGYSFSKAHSASFAVESYQSLFLKTYYPAEFLVAVINNFGGFYNTELYFQQLKKSGVTVKRPCVNISEELTTIADSSVYPGLGLINGIKNETIATIIAERNANGSYLHLQNFIERTSIKETQLELLIDVSALSFTGKTKKHLLWEACLLQANARSHVPASISLFGEEAVRTTGYNLPLLLDDRLEDLYSDIENLRFTVDNIFLLVDVDLRSFVAAKELPHYVGLKVNCLGYLICTKNTYTKKDRKAMFFGTWIDSRGDWIDTVHFPAAAAAYPFQGRGFYHIYAEVTEQFGVITLTALEMTKVGVKGTVNKKLISG